ncbi:MAG TPA: hypothetical protein VMU20_17465 [Candidatus Dormibacteraeota bacterium]|nr:hypothetical protein [Candidatus Dormibacteraeota bacterium]
MLPVAVAVGLPVLVPAAEVLLGETVAAVVVHAALVEAQTLEEERLLLEQDAQEALDRP